MARAAVLGISGPLLTDAEADLFRAYPPAGIILFGRNVRDPGQLGQLMASLRAVLPPDAVLMVDQEGGRVARLRPPYWCAHPPAAAIGRLFDDDPARALRAAWLTGALIGLDCRAAGFDLAAAPVLDLSIPGAHDVIGDRAYAASPAIIARCGRAVGAGLMAAGVTPIGKHVPGHGRTRVDSHLAPPYVDDADLTLDMRPFQLNADLPWMMTAHIVYRAIDSALPATLSPTVIQSVIRERIGFQGVLVTDDLAMQALTGSRAELAAQALAAGCDLALYCAGDAETNAEVLRACPPLSDLSRQRLAAARATVATRRMTLRAADLAAERDRLL